MMRTMRVIYLFFQCFIVKADSLGSNGKFEKYKFWKEIIQQIDFLLPRTEYVHEEIQGEQ